MRMHDIHKACSVQDQVVPGTYQVWNRSMFELSIRRELNNLYVYKK